jgi:hypothetical protein
MNYGRTLILLSILSLTCTAVGAPEGARMPAIEGPWWQVAGNPTDHKYATEKQEPVDFAVWQAADGTWQLWSCIRKSTAGGEAGMTRFFYRWEGQKLTDVDWQPMGVAMEADPSLGETPGGLQAPHVVKVDKTYHMFYGDWVHICHATSTDGKTFTRVIQANGKTGLFSEGPDANTRDIMMLRHDGLWYGYYTCHPSRQGMVCVRTTEDFRNWSDSTVAAFGGQAGTTFYSAECPHVIEPAPGQFYLLRTQSYGQPRTSVYFSTDPKMFGINQDSRHLLGTLPVAAPEIIRHEGRYYIAALNEGTLDGIRIARLRFH